MTGSILSLIFSLFTPVILEYLKSKPWAPFINANTPRLNAIFAFIVAAGASIGLTFQFNADTLTIGGLNLERIAVTGATALLAWLTQEIVYRLAVRK